MRVYIRVYMRVYIRVYMRLYVNSVGFHILMLGFSNDEFWVKFCVCVMLCVLSM